MSAAYSAAAAAPRKTAPIGGKGGKGHYGYGKAAKKALHEGARRHRKASYDSFKIYITRILRKNSVQDMNVSRLALQVRAVSLGGSAAAAPGRRRAGPGLRFASARTDAYASS